MHMVCKIVPYAYVTKYAYGTEHLQYVLPCYILQYSTPDAFPVLYGKYSTDFALILPHKII